MSSSPGDPGAPSSPEAPSLEAGLPPLPVAGSVAGAEELVTVQQIVLVERWLRALRTWTTPRAPVPEKLQEPGPHGRA